MSTNAVVESLDRSFGLYRDLFPLLDEAVLVIQAGRACLRTPCGAQLWCVIGARERLCTGDRRRRVGRLLVLARVDRRPRQGLRGARPIRGFGLRGGAVDAIEQADAQERLVLDLLEHEAQHHGQLIRYLYGLRLPVPASWRSRYGLD